MIVATFRRLALCFLMTAAACSYGAADGSLWTVGVAKVDLTPDYPIWLSIRPQRTTPTEKVLQRVYAKAIAIGSDEQNPAVLITVDTSQITSRMRAEILNRLQKKTKVRSETLAICATHTHAGPMLSPEEPGMFTTHLKPGDYEMIARYTRDFTDKLEQVALAALADRRPGGLSWGAGSVGWARNRRPNWAFSPVDHSVPVLRVSEPDGKLRAVLTSYACHATALGSINQLHGDWPGCTQAYLEREFPGAIAMVAIGCGGDANPLPRGTWQHAVDYGEQLGAEAKRVVTGNLKPISGSLTCRLAEFTIPLDKLPTRAEFEARARGKDKVIAYNAGAQLAKLDRGEKLVTEFPYSVQSWSFGKDLVMVFLAGEVVVDYSLRLKREFDSERIWVNCYANDRQCYIPSERVLREGGYEGEYALNYGSRFPTRIAPGVENRIVGAVHRIVPDEFKQRD